MTVLSNKRGLEAGLDAAPLDDGAWGPGAGAGAPAAAEPPAQRTLGASVRAYVALTKPRVIELLLITTIPVMFLADGGVPPLSTVLLTLAFGTMSAGAANAVNCYIDRDIDAKMRRTRRRPLARHQVTPARALIFGITLAALSTAGFLLAVNPVAAAGSLFAILFYVFVYSLLLKRRTPQNVVWGGIAGCMPVLIGWAAVTGGVAWTPLVLFGVVFLWTPPHTWTLAMRYREDYAVAKVPMLPVVATERRVVTESLLYTYATVACSLLLWPVGGMGPVYGAVAVVLGLVFLAEGHRLLRAVRAGVTGVHLRPMRFFHLSNVYLALLFTAVAVDPILR